MLDNSIIIKDFPILERPLRGKRLVYLDSAASSQKPLQVLEAMDRYYREDHANVHRGVHTLAERATAAFEGARAKVAGFVGVPPECLIWTRGTTEAVNLVAYAWARRTLQPGDEILLTVMEHHSNLVPWQLVAADTGATLRFIPMNSEYALDLTRLDSLLTDRTRLVSLAHMSNALGTIHPVRKIADAAHARGALVFVDAAQSVPHMPVDLEALGADFLAFSAHKMLGPTGIGALAGRRAALEQLAPFRGGGELIPKVDLARSTCKPLPARLEAGTPAIAEAVGFAAAVDYLNAVGMEAVAEHEHAITDYALDVLQRLGVRVLGPKHDRGGAISFAVEGVHPHDLATILDSDGVAVRAGHHCAQPLMEILGVPATARASFYLYNTREDVDALAAAIEKARRIFSGSPA